MVKGKGRLKMFAEFVEVPNELKEVFSEKAKNNKLDFGTIDKNITQEVIDFEHKFFKRFLIASYDYYNSKTFENFYLYIEDELTKWCFEDYLYDIVLEKEGEDNFKEYIQYLHDECFEKSSTAYSIVKEEDIESLREELGIKDKVVEEVIYIERKRTIPEKILIKLLRLVGKSSK